jgi:hypothetical protein
MYRLLTVAACRWRGLRPDGRSSVFSCDRRPFPDIPPLDYAARHIGICLGKLLRYLGGISLEEQDRAIDRVRERATQQEFTSLACFPGLLKVRLAKRSTRLDTPRQLRRTKDTAF